MTTRTCQSCGAEVASNALQGLCPKCVASVAFSAREEESPEQEQGALLGTIRYFGDYQLLEEIARGGMGVVFKARQVSLNRIVAVKMILAGQFAEAAEVSRFRSEAQAAAHLKHPNIVTIHEVGEQAGQHYFSMDWIDGASLAELARDHPLPVRRAADYLKKLADAVQHAHEQGILHRDLKPSNVLIDPFDEPRITDFGLAKRVTEDPDLTLTGQVLGTPGFIAPEQASGTRDQLGPRSDVYSLGAILYYVLTGRAPFVGETMQQTLAQVLNHSPASPRLVNPATPRDLETICLKCLEKDPHRRYGSAGELADDLDRFLRDKPIRARPVGMPEKAWRWCRRHPTVAVLSAIVLLLLVAVAVGSTAAAVRIDAARKAEASERERAEAIAREEERQRHRAEANALLETQQRQRAIAALRDAEFQRAEDFVSGGRSAEGVAALARLLREEPANVAVAERLISTFTYRSWPMPIRSFAHSNWVGWAQFSPDGTKLATGSHDRTARIWNVATGELLFPPLQHGGGVTCVYFSDDGRRFLTCSRDSKARVWGTTSGEPLTDPLPHDSQNSAARLSPNGRLALTNPGDRTLRIWDVDKGAESLRLQHSGEVTAARFSPDGKHLLAASHSSLLAWDVTSGEAVFAPINLGDAIEYWTLNSQGDLFVLCVGKSALLFDAASGQRTDAPPLRHSAIVRHATFSSDGSRVATASDDGSARVWNVDTGQLLATVKHAAAVAYVQFSPDDLSILTASKDTSVRLWNAFTGEPMGEPLWHNREVSRAQFSPNGRRVVTVSGISGQARLWDVHPGAASVQSVAHRASIIAAEFNHDGSRFLTASWDGTARVWDAHSLQPLGEPMRHQNVLFSARFSRDGARVVTAAHDNTARVWDAVTGQPVTPPLDHKSTVTTAAISPGGEKVVTGSFDRTARIWSAGTGEPITPPLPHGGMVFSAVFDPAGSRILTACEDGKLRLWNATTGELVMDPMKAGSYLRGAWFSHDGARIVSFYYEMAARTWETATGRRLSEPMPHRTYLLFAEFSPDDQLLATASEDQTARIWDALTAEPVTRSLHHDAIVRSAKFSPDGARVATASEDGTARVWDVRTGWPVSEPLRHQREVVWAEFSPDGQRLLTASSDGTAKVWEMPIISEPPPLWLADLAEAVAQRRQDQWIDFDALFKIRASIEEDTSADFYTRWAKWFFADRATRVASPF